MPGWRRNAAVALAVAVALTACEPEDQASPPELTLAPVGFDRLAGWAEDRHAEALSAFTLSCGRIERMPGDRAFGRVLEAGTAADWQEVCRAAQGVATGEARGFLERWFVPYAVSDGDDAIGLFTGYYEPLLEGARQPDPTYRWPLYRRPPDLVTVDLGEFADDLTGRRLAGRLEGSALKPFASRAEIDGGALRGRGLELLWIADPIEGFFLEIQGSGRVRLPSGETIRVGYAGQNGHPYRAIGRDLVESGALDRDRLSMQAIRGWLRDNPGQATSVLQKNPSYVFFRELPAAADDPGPPGAQGVPLTPGRSLAVDRKFVPLGAPLWLDISLRTDDGERPLRRLVIAQDTGGAIRGVVRGDLFWGAGDEAENVAGGMKQAGRYFILLPRSGTPVS